MASDTNVNSIISQGIAIKQIYNPKKMDLELQQHFNVQNSELKKEKDKTKIKKTGNENRVENKSEEPKDSAGQKSNRRSKERQPKPQDHELNSEGNLIDIKV